MASDLISPVTKDAWLKWVNSFQFDKQYYCHLKNGLFPAWPLVKSWESSLSVRGFALLSCSSTLFLLQLALNLPIATKVICFSRLLKSLRSLYGKQCGLRSDCSYRSSLLGAVCSGPTLFASILNSSVC